VGEEMTKECIAYSKFSYEEADCRSEHEQLSLELNDAYEIVDMYSHNYRAGSYATVVVDNDDVKRLFGHITRVSRAVQSMIRGVATKVTVVEKEVHIEIRISLP
jgi:hypothetical protein